MLSWSRLFIDSEDADDSMYGGGGLIPPAPPGGCNDNRLMKSRAPQRSGGGSSLRPARTGRRPSVGSGPPQVQLLSIPQLDAIQRSLKLLDVRLQHIQTSAKDDEKSRDNIDHIRRVMSENQKALSTVVTVLSAIQEEVRSLSIAVHHQQKSTLQIQAPRKRSSERSTSSGEGLRDREGSSSVKLMNDTMDTAQVWYPHGYSAGVISTWIQRRCDIHMDTAQAWYPHGYSAGVISSWIQRRCDIHMDTAQVWYPHGYSAGVISTWIQRRRDIHMDTAQVWYPHGYSAGVISTWIQRRCDIHMDTAQVWSLHAHPILVWCWPSVADAGPTQPSIGIVKRYSAGDPTRRSPNVGLMLAKRRRHWTNIKPILGI